MKEPFFYSEPVDSVLELVGNTPLVRVNKLAKKGSAAVFAKIEFFNICGSIKDRICNSMIESAEREGKIKPGDTIVEPTSGNTGIGLAFVCAAKGYKLVLTMPETMSVERRTMLKAFGAELILTEGSRDMIGAVEKAQELAESKGYFQPQQFKNPANPEAHRKGTASEIISQMQGVDAFVAGVGTGGTITGVGEILKKEPGARVSIVAVEPAKSPVLSGGDPGLHGIQGIGAGFIPDVLNKDIIDEIIQVSDEEAFEIAGRLIREEGILCGISSGANMFAALKKAEELGSGSKIVVVFPDTGERYLSTKLFDR
ncbi:MAG TPA: cysteine synthase A [Nitrospirae bacterium]|nr:cysteine synthase [bacterium BMS3Abin10]GBE39356.1 cysteine synthase [bacterium BMS3Bbin08]HDK81601.1 cysteine synthase A [Nitrospirota bacterium]